MASSLSNLANNLVKGIHKTKYTNCNTCFLNTNAKNDLIEYKCLCCNELPKKKFDKNLKKRFTNIYRLATQINKFILLLQQGVYPYEYMDDW